MLLLKVGQSCLDYKKEIMMVQKTTKPKNQGECDRYFGYKDGGIIRPIVICQSRYDDKPLDPKAVGAVSIAFHDLTKSNGQYLLGQSDGATILSLPQNTDEQKTSTSTSLTLSYEDEYINKLATKLSPAIATFESGVVVATVENPDTIIALSGENGKEIANDYAIARGMKLLPVKEDMDDESVEILADRAANSLMQIDLNAILPNYKQSFQQDPLYITPTQEVYNQNLNQTTCFIDYIRPPSIEGSNSLQATRLEHIHNDILYSIVAYRASNENISLKNISNIALFARVQDIQNFGIKTPIDDRIIEVIIESNSDSISLCTRAKVEGIRLGIFDINESRNITCDDMDDLFFGTILDSNASQEPMPNLIGCSGNGCDTE